MSLSTETGIQLTPFRAEDAVAMDLTAQAGKVMLGVDLMETFRLYETKGPGWTLRIGDQIIACAGLMFPWPTLAIAWLLPSPHLPTYPMTAVKVLLTQLRTLMQQHRPRRIEFLVDASFYTGQRFAEFLGYWREGCCPDTPCAQCGLMRGYGPNGEDYIRYVWVRDP